jgi:hypothetical protein
MSNGVLRLSRDRFAERVQNSAPRDVGDLVLKVG